MTRVVAQRVRSASVSIDGRTVAEIGRGFAVLIGIRRGDDEAAVLKVADKLAVLRVFEDADGKMNLSAAEAKGEMLAVSQFTLYADIRKGRRPSFLEAEQPARGAELYDRFCRRLEEHGYRVARGEFGAYMLVSLVNDGPVTIILDSSEL